MQHTEAYRKYDHTLSQQGASLVLRPCVVTDSHVLAQYHDEWDALYDGMSDVSNFQSFSWNLALAEFHERNGCKIHVIFYYYGDDLVGIVPLYVHRVFGVTVFRWLTDPFGQYGDILCDDEAGEDLLRMIAQDLSQLRAGGLYLRKVRKNSRFWKVPFRVRLFEGNFDRAPFLVTDLYDNETIYLESRSKRFRKTLRKLLRHRDAQHIEARQLDVASDVIDKMIAMKASQLKAQGIYAIGYHNDDINRVLKRIYEIAPDQIHIWGLFLGHDIMAMELSCLNHCRVEGYIAGYDPRYDDHSPGHILTYSVIAKMLERPHIQVDLLAPYDRYKAEFLDHSQDISDVFIVRGFGGFGFYYFVFLFRPVLKKIVLKAYKLLRSLNPFG